MKEVTEPKHKPAGWSLAG